MKASRVQEGACVKRALCHDNSLDSSLAMHRQDSQGSEFMGFDTDKSSFLTYHWRPLAATENETSSSQIGDGCIIRKPYRLVSKLFSVNNEETEEQLTARTQRWRQCHVKNIETFQNLFGQPEIKKLAPVQRTLTVRSATPARSRREKPLSVSPLTGHVLGLGELKVVDKPRRRVQSAAGRCHTPLW